MFLFCFLVALLTPVSCLRENQEAHQEPRCCPRVRFSLQLIPAMTERQMLTWQRWKLHLETLAISVGLGFFSEIVEDAGEQLSLCLSASLVCIEEAKSISSQPPVHPSCHNLCHSTPHRSNGTSMISLIIPPKDMIARVNKMLGDEYGTASNIKSRVNRY